MSKILVVLAIAAIALMAGCLNGPPYIVMADINNDGLSDMVITQYDAEASGDMISVLINSGTNESFAQEVITDSIKKGSTFVTDVNKDGKLDILFNVFGEKKPWKVLYGKGDGTFEKSKVVEAIDMQQFIKPN